MLAVSPFRNIYLFSFKGFFLMWTVFKVFTESLQYCFCFVFCFLAKRHVGSWLPEQGSNLHPLHWKVKS